MAARRRMAKKTTAGAKVRRAKRGGGLQRIGDELGRAERALMAYARGQARGNASRVEKHLRETAGKVAGASAAALGRIRREIHTGETAAELRRKLDELVRGKKLRLALVRKPRA